MQCRISVSPCTDGERLSFSPFDEDSSCHLLAEKSQDCDKVGWATNSGQNFPESFTVGGLEGLNQVNESYVKILVLFLTFLLKLTGHKDHVRGSLRCPEATLAFR